MPKPATNPLSLDPPLEGNNIKGQHNARALALLIQAAGDSVPDLARMLGVSYQTVNDWVKRKQISRKGALLVENHSVLGQYFIAKDLRVDL